MFNQAISTHPVRKRYDGLDADIMGGRLNQIPGRCDLRLDHPAAINLTPLLFSFPETPVHTWRYLMAFVAWLIQTVAKTSDAASPAFAHCISGDKVRSAVRHGTVVGVVAGAVSLGLSFGVRTLLEPKPGMVASLREAASPNTAPASTFLRHGPGCEMVAITTRLQAR